ncbi:MAG: threonine aldolase [Chitinophagaceae bacterium]|jgi:threonine aldolase|nr:threonine aldolase [Chitinophagaceae bacterium]
MKEMHIDLRSDTVTRPSAEMLQFMFNAQVGDDVFEEDPTINELEHKAAEMFGKQAGLFCASGTMSNQIAIKVHTRLGDEVICDELSHIYQYEGGGVAFNSGCSMKLLQGSRGRITAGQVSQSINNPNDVHKPLSTLVSLENTANRGGGSCYDFSEIEKIKAVCLQNNLALHLDGARIFNALVAKNETPEQYGEMFDTISVCLSKGLGAPVGSVLLGSKDFIKKARRVRKVFGGGMRQAGYLAAAGIYALEHNIQRLAEDHFHAKKIAEALAQKSFVGNISPVETNILIFEVKEKYTPVSFTQKLKEENISAMAISPTQVRLVLHLNITPAMVDKVIHFIQSL